MRLHPSCRFASIDESMLLGLVAGFFISIGFVSPTAKAWKAGIAVRGKSVAPGGDGTD